MKRSVISAGTSNFLALAWGVCVLAMLAGLYRITAHGVPLESSLLAMLPELEQDPALHDLTQQLSGRAARTLLILVGSEQREEALAAAASVEHELRSASEFSALTGAFDSGKERAFFDLYFPHRYSMLSAQLRARLVAGAAPKEMLERVRQLLQSPFSSLYTGILSRDPLLLYPDFVQGWATQRIGGIASEGFLTVEDGPMTYAILAAETAADPFDTSGQRAALDRIEGVRTKLVAHFTGARLLYTGVLRFAAHSREAMQRDLMIIGIGSMLGTALCILAVFRSVRPFLLSFLPVGVGTAAATLVCFLAFDRVHVLTLVFGTSLTGLGVDYALHYFAVHRMTPSLWNARASMRDILPAITLGVVTSIVGFSGLYFTPFPVLRQFALFSSVGLIAAWATVVCWFPPLMIRPHRLTSIPWMHRQSQAFLDAWLWMRQRRWAKALLLSLCVAALAAVVNLRFQDDVRKLQTRAPDLIEQDRQARQLAGRTDDSRFVLVEGATEEETLERLEQTATLLNGAVEARLVENYRDLSLFLPSRARQLADHDLLASKLGPRFDELAAGLDDLGLDTAVIDDLRRSLTEKPVNALDVEAWLASPASEFQRALWLGRTSRGFGATLLLGGVADGAGIEKLLADREGVHYVDRVRDLSELLRRYRVDSTRLVVIAYAGVLLALMLRFGVRHGTRVMLPSLLAAGLTLGLLEVSGVELNLFHLLGLLLVLGQAVDYGVFFAENGASEATTMFALTLSVITTVLAFGMMVSSSAPPLQSLGASVSIGMVLSLVLSPLAFSSSPKHSTPAIPP